MDAALNVVSDPRGIGEHQRKFQEKLISESAQRIDCFLGYQGGRTERTVFWFEGPGYWVSFNRLENRYWNAFGVARPDRKSNLSITCEINFPLEGVDLQIAGAFGRADSGGICIVHRGIIGGGRVGIGRDLFMQEYVGRWVDLDDMGKISRVALVCNLGERSIAEDVGNFVKQIYQIKERRVASGNSNG